MNQDTTMQGVRYGLIMLGGYLAGRGIIPADQVVSFVGQVMNIIPGIIAVATAAWGFYVKYRTKAVPDATAARSDVPTVSPVTGAVTK